MTGRREHRRVFPFTAMVGQHHLKLAMIINAVVPGGLGVLIRGEKGTGKSTCARALAHLLPDIPVVKGCSLHCDPGLLPERGCPDCRKQPAADIAYISFPFVTLPVNTSEDNLVGGLDFAHALKSGRKRFKPGVLGAAHRGILYVDEVNLLDDYLSDLVTDVSVSGINIVEREGVGFVHEAGFSLVATMNPEEGELRPQLMDRFGLCVNIFGIDNPTLRLELLRRVNAFERDPEAFLATWEPRQRQEKERIRRAMQLYDAVTMTDRQLAFIVAACRQAAVAGHRADIFANQAARALAAYDRRTMVNARDVRAGLGLALPHRMRPAEKNRSAASAALPEIVKRMDRPQGAVCPRDTETPSLVNNDIEDYLMPFRTRMGEGEEESEVVLRPGSRQGDLIVDIEDSVIVSAREVRHKAALARQKKGRHHRTVAHEKRGRYIRFTRLRTNNDIALDATIRAAAINQKNRPTGLLAVNILPEDIREKIREHKSRAVLIFVVDASGSMGTQLMRESKGAILSLLLEAYQNRDQVGLIAFTEETAEVLLPPTNSIELAEKKLRDLPAGGKTPLAAGLIKGYETAVIQRRRNRKNLPVLILVSDGRANVGVSSRISYSMERAGRIYDEIFSLARTIRNDLLVQSLVINTEQETHGGFGMAERIAEHLGARYIAPERICAESITRAVHQII